MAGYEKPAATRLNRMADATVAGRAACSAGLCQQFSTVADNGWFSQPPLMTSTATPFPDALAKRLHAVQKLIANELIAVINAKYSTALQPVQ